MSLNEMNGWRIYQIDEDVLARGECLEIYIIEQGCYSFIFLLFLCTIFSQIVEFDESGRIKYQCFETNIFLYYPRCVFFVPLTRFVLDVLVRVYTLCAVRIIFQRRSSLTASKFFTRCCSRVYTSRIYSPSNFCLHVNNQCYFSLIYYIFLKKNLCIKFLKYHE